MNKEFVPYEQALALRELGFDDPCFAFYYEEDFELNVKGDTLDIIPKKFNSCFLKESKYFQSLMVSSPLWQQAFKWFREKHNFLHTVNIDLSNDLKDKIYIYTIEDHLGSIIDRSEEYNSYEQAELACLNKLINLLQYQLK